MLEQLQALVAEWQNQARVIARHHTDQDPAALALNACAADLAPIITEMKAEDDRETETLLAEAPR